jgi:allophanate hydrolase subunit 2
MWRLAQTPIGGQLRFQCVDMQAALAADEQQQTYVATVRRAVEQFFQDA